MPLRPAPLALHLAAALLLAISLPSSASAAAPAGRRAAAGDAPQTRSGDGVFELGAVVVRGQRRKHTAAGESILPQRQIERFSRDTVGEALNTAAGISVSRNSRNEDTISLRGFDSRQVPVFVDGIPLYVPYDGYVDFGRFTTFDLAEIRIAKGAASMLYGPNAMGGAINLVTRKPVEAFEGDVRFGVASGGERKAAVNIGANRGSWYAQAGLSYLDADGFPLPKGFRDYKAVPTDTGDARANADRSDRKLSFKIGITPNDSDEYALGYVKQDGEKGNPVYTGRSSGGIRYWRWPWWDKQSLYFIGNTAFGAHDTLKLRAYRDRYGNGLRAYADASYRQQLDDKNFPSVYDDDARGASAEWINSALPGHQLHLALHYKDDRHDDRNPNSPRKRYRDVTVSAALEDHIRLGDASRLRLGVSREQRDARKVYFWPTGTTNATNALAELVHDLPGDGQVFFSVSRKTRFPTIKDRYSAGMGTALPNPDLKPELARHLELGWRGQPWPGAQLEATLFHSRIDDRIQSNVVASDACKGGFCNQAQNIGSARHRGIELALQQRLGDRWRIGGNYTWLDRDNLSNPAMRLTNTPTHKLFVHAGVEIGERWELLATLDAESGREALFSGAGQTGYRALARFATTGAKLVWTPAADFAIEAGGKNLGDKWYALADGFPMPGRTWYANATYRF